MMYFSKRSTTALVFVAVLIAVTLSFVPVDLSGIWSPSLALPSQDVLWMGSSNRSSEQLVVGYDRQSNRFVSIQLSNDDNFRFLSPSGILLTRSPDRKRVEFASSKIACQTLSLENNKVILSKPRTIISEIPGFVWKVIGLPDDRIYLASNQELKGEETFVGRNYVYIGSWQENFDVHLNSQVSDGVLDEFQFAQHYEGVDIQYLDQTREMVLIGSTGAPSRFVGASHSLTFESPHEPKSQLFTDSGLNRIATIRAFNSAWKLNVWGITSGLKLKELVFDDGIERLEQSTAGGVFLTEKDCLTYFDRQVVWWKLDLLEASCAQSVRIDPPDDMQIDSMHRFNSGGVLAIGYVDRSNSRKFMRDYYICRIDLAPDRRLDIGQWELVESTAQ